MAKTVYRQRGAYVEQVPSASAPSPWYGEYIVAAHRGIVLGGVPENSIDSLRLAWRYGYKIVEVDPKFTADGVLVALHDGTLNRTMENVDGTEIEGSVRVSEKTLSELRSQYRLKSSDPKFRRPIPTLEEFFLECRRLDIIPMIDNKLGSIEPHLLAQRVLGSAYIAFCNSFDVLMQTREFFNGLCLLNSAASHSQVVPMLKEIGGWAGVSSLNAGAVSQEAQDALHENGFVLQASIMGRADSVRKHYQGVDFQLSDWLINLSGRQMGVSRKRLPDMTTTGSTVALGVQLDAGEELLYEHDTALEYHAIDVFLEVEGSVKILLNGQNYGEHIDIEGTLRASNIGHSSAPKIEIRGGVGGALVRSVEISVADV